MNYSMSQDGFTVFENAVDIQVLYDLIYRKENFDIPTRGHDVDGKYHKSHPIANVKWANYWTLALNDNYYVEALRKETDRIAEKFLDRPVFYHSDVSVLTADAQIIRPHVDTPHRHKPFNNIQERLGIQMAIPLSVYNEENGMPGLVPTSHQSVWDIRECYQGVYDGYFMTHNVQPHVEYGDVLVWDTRTLHSQMPNDSDMPRYLLLMNYVEENIVKELAQYESELALSD